MSKAKSPKSTPPPETLTLKLEPKLAALLRACAAWDGIPPEAFALEALRNNLVCCTGDISRNLNE